MQKQMTRKGIYTIDFVFDKLGDSIFKRKNSYIIFDNEEIKANSQRYQVFKTKGCKCCLCGLEASYFALERHNDSERYHLNLYATKNGQEILFTKDHIIPKAKGGKDVLGNYQTLCQPCNEAKKDN